jgi:hypothetical protein
VQAPTEFFVALNGSEARWDDAAVEEVAHDPVRCGPARLMREVVLRTEIGVV